MDVVLLQVLLTFVGFVGLGISLFGFPGAFLVYLSALIFAIQSDFSEASIRTLIIAGIVTLSTIIVDELAAVIGAKKYGASSRGIAGTFIGGMVGFFGGGPIAMVVGAFIGGLIAEITGSDDIKKALRAGLGLFIGYLAGIIFKFVITLALFIWMLTVIW